MQMTGLERLRVLADFLESDAVPEGRFDMAAWWRQEPCGAVCCAFGWAYENQALRDEGLLLIGRGKKRTVAFGDDIAFDAAARFFGLRYEFAVKAFSPDYYARKPTKAAVVARLRQLIASGAA
jgi:hypothetical protein